MNGSVVIFLALALGSIETLACRDHWVSFGTSCYAFVDEKVTWSTAMEVCRSLQARLVEVNDAEENAFIVSEMKARNYPIAWTGIQDFLVEGQWVTTSDQLPATYFNWAHGEPNNDAHGESGQDCVRIYVNGQWDDFFCDTTHNVDVICEYDLGDEVTAR